MHAYAQSSSMMHDWLCFAFLALCQLKCAGRVHRTLIAYIGRGARAVKTGRRDDPQAAPSRNRFSPGGTIRLSAGRTAGGGIALAIADTGIGMNAEEVIVALRPFRQVDNALSRRYEGTGLGLPLAQRLIELHGGKLNIESVPGQGTTVTVSLPPKRVLS